MKKLKQAILILSIPAITLFAACGQEETAYAPEVKEDISLAQETEDPADSAQEEQEAKEEAERQAKEQAEAEEAAAQEKAEREAKAEEEAAAKKKAKEEAAAADKEQIQGYREEAFLQQGRDGMIGVANIEFSQVEKTYYLYPIDPMIIDEIHNLVNYGQGVDDWNYLVESLVVLSQAAQQVVGDGYKIMFMNPVNEDNVLVIVEDGQVLYNAVDDL